MSLSTVETVLTRPFRVAVATRIPFSILQKYAFVISLFSCACSGTVILYSLWTPYFTKDLGYTQFQVNIIGGMASIGMYLLLPIIGNLADVYGTVLLSVLAIFTFCPSYYLAASVYESSGGYWLMTGCFSMVGLGTSCLYFASLLTCANIYPDSKGLSISLPVTCYGLSSLVASRIIELNYFKDKSTSDNSDSMDLNLARIFRFFSLLYVIIGTLNYTSSCILTMQKQAQFLKQPGEIDEEETPLLAHSIGSHTSVDDALQHDELITEIDSINEISHKKKYQNFLREPSAYLFLAAFFLCIGPLEMYINNMGSLTVLINKLNKQVSPNLTSFGESFFIALSNSKKLHSISVSSQVAYHAFSSTIIRLFIGAVSDYMALKSPTKLIFKNGFSRVWFLIFSLAVGAIDQFGIVYMLWNYTNGSGVSNWFFKLISAGSGLSYGGIFTIYPSIMASIWGVEILGSTWGLYMIAPAFASILFGVVYAKIYDSYNDYRLYSVFVGTGLSICISLAIAIFTWKVCWKRKGFDIF